MGLLGRKLLVALIVLLFSASAFSQFYVITSHGIELNADAQGNANVSEKFFLLFQNSQQLAEFRDKASEVGVSLDGWKAYDSRLHPYIGSEGEFVVSKVAFVEGEAPHLEITYALKEPLMEKKGETSRVIDYTIRKRFFNAFLSGSLWVIPDNTAITTNLPPGAELQQPVEPEAEIVGNRVTWRGYKNTNKLTLNYRVFKQIASFDAMEMLEQLMQSNLFWVVVAAIVVVGAGLFWKRRSIAGRIESYVVQHSDLSKEEEED